MDINGVLAILFISGIVILDGTSLGRAEPYKEDCRKKLLQDKRLIPDESITQSDFVPQYYGKYIRTSYSNRKGWCLGQSDSVPPSESTYSTNQEHYVEIDLGQLTIIAMMMTKGTEKISYVSASSFMIRYKRESDSDWKMYSNYSGIGKIPGRRDPLNEMFNYLKPPLVARWIRIIPNMKKGDRICLKIELYGCMDTNHVVEYQIPQGSLDLSATSFNHKRRYLDNIYDGEITLNGQMLKGTGKLTDCDLENGNTDSPVKDGSIKFVGWNKNKINKDFVEILFRFENGRKFKSIHLRASNHFDYQIRIFKKIELQSAWLVNGQKIVDSPLKTKSMIRDNKLRTNRWIDINLDGIVGNIIVLRLYFASAWIIMSEAQFKSDPYPMPKNVLSKIGSETKIPNQTPKSTNSSPQSTKTIKKYTKTTKITKINFSNKENSNKSHKSSSIAMPLGIICGCLAIVILSGCLVIVYRQNWRKCHSPMKERVLHLKYSDNHEFFLPHDNENYTAHLSKGTFIPFNISPHHNNPTLYNHTLRSIHKNKATGTAVTTTNTNPTQLPQQSTPSHYYTTCRNNGGTKINNTPTQLSTTNPTLFPPPFLTPNHQNANSYYSPQFYSPIHYHTNNPNNANNNMNTTNSNTNRSLENCVYTSLPASDTDDSSTLNDTPEHQNQYLQQRIYNLPTTINNCTTVLSQKNLNGGLGYPNTPILQQGSLFRNNNAFTENYDPNTNTVNGHNINTNNILCNNNISHGGGKMDNIGVDPSNSPFKIHHNFASGLGITYSNNLKEFDTFQNPTWQDSDDNDDEDIESYTNHVSYKDRDLYDISGCCGNSTYLSLKPQLFNKPNLHKDWTIRTSKFKTNLIELEEKINNIFSTKRNYSKSEWNNLGLLGRGFFGQIRLDKYSISWMKTNQNEQPVLLITSSASESSSTNQNIHPDSICALKILQDQCPIEIKEKFLQELTLLSSLPSHPHIVQLISLYHEPIESSSRIHSIVGVFEYSELGDLYSFLQKLPNHQFDIATPISTNIIEFNSRSCGENNNVFSQATVHQILLQLTDALYHISTHQLVHRDVSCRNCLVYRAQQPLPLPTIVPGDNALTTLSMNIQIKLSDTAMSSSCFQTYYQKPNLLFSENDNGYYSDKLSICSLIVPLRWCAPEVIFGTIFSQKSDIFSFGLTIWEIITKCSAPPFPELTNKQVITNALPISPAPSNDFHIPTKQLLLVPSTCANKLVDLIFKCCQYQHENRPNIYDIQQYLQYKL